MRSLTRLSIKSKLIVMLLAISSGSILVTAYQGYRSGQTNLTDRAFNHWAANKERKSFKTIATFRF